MARAAAKREAVMVQEAFAFDLPDVRAPLDAAKPHQPARARRAGGDMLGTGEAGASLKAPRQQTASQRPAPTRASTAAVLPPAVPTDTVLAVGAPPVGTRRKKPAVPSASAGSGRTGPETVNSVPAGADPSKQGRKRAPAAQDRARKRQPDAPDLASPADHIPPIPRLDGPAAPTASLTHAAPSSPRTAVQASQRGGARRGRATGADRGHSGDGPAATTVDQDLDPD